MKKKAISLFLLVLIVLAAGCVGSGGKTASTSPSATGTPPTKSGGIDFSAYGNGEVLSNWYRLANASTVYASEGYEDLAKHYFPNARVLPPASQYDGGIAILSPKDARPILRGKPILITVNDYFGYIATSSASSSLERIRASSRRSTRAGRPTSSSRGREGPVSAPLSSTRWS